MSPLIIAGAGLIIAVLKVKQLLKVGGEDSVLEYRKPLKHNLHRRAKMCKIKLPPTEPVLYLDECRLFRCFTGTVTAYSPGVT